MSTTVIPGLCQNSLDFLCKSASRQSLKDLVIDFGLETGGLALIIRLSRPGKVVRVLALPGARGYEFRADEAAWCVRCADAAAATLEQLVLADAAAAALGHPAPAARACR